MNTQPKLPSLPPPLPPPPRSRREGLIFAPLAWLKLQFFLHAGSTEIGGFGISSADDLLYIEEFRTVRQSVSAVTVEFDDQAVADHFDRCVDQGIEPQRCARIWIHTHPGESAQPSQTDEKTFMRVFGACDWSVMFIVGRTDRTYARLAFSAGPGAQMLLPVSVDWESWPRCVADPAFNPDELFSQWMEEYRANITLSDPVRDSAFDLSDLDCWQGDSSMIGQEDWFDNLDERAAREVLT